MAEAAVPETAQQGVPEFLMEMRIPARADRIKLIRPAIETAAAMCGLRPPATRDVVLAVDEACQNIIVHGYKGRADGDVSLRLSRMDDGLLAELRDSAPRIDPAKIKHRALGDVRPGKLGTYFMGAIMDRVEYLPAPGGGNLLRMFRRKDKTS